MALPPISAQAQSACWRVLYYKSKAETCKTGSQEPTCHGRGHLAGLHRDGDSLDVTTLRGPSLLDRIIAGSHGHICTRHNLWLVYLSEDSIYYVWVELPHCI